jgi:hypothetical protein
MRTHFEFSIFTADGAAYGRAGKYLDITTPVVGQTLSIFEIGDGEVKNIDLPQSAINEIVYVKIEEVDIASNIDEFGQPQHFSVQLSDLIFESKSIALKAVGVLNELGFDCDVWSEQSEKQQKDRGRSN